MDHQSIADLKDCPADLKGDAVVGAVVENARIQTGLPGYGSGYGRLGVKCQARFWWMT